MKRTQIEDVFTIDDIGSTLLNDLAKGLYKWDEVVREYIQNAVDAHRMWFDHTGDWPQSPIHVEIMGEEISFNDYGIGMDLNEVKTVKAIAVSNKRVAEIELTGYKGVGIWAGLSYFEKFQLETTRRGEQKKYILEIDFGKIVNSIKYNVTLGKALNPHYTIFEDEADENEHGTRVTLSKPTAERSFLNVDLVKDAISRVCPCQIDPSFIYHKNIEDWYEHNELYFFHMEVNGQRVYRSFPNTVEQLEFGDITLDDRVVARFWRGLNIENERFPDNAKNVGFKLVKNGFVLGGANPYGEEILPEFSTIKIYNYLYWQIGEIHILSQELQPDLPRRQLESSFTSFRFIEVLRAWYQDRHDFLRVYSYQRRFTREYEAYIKLIDKVERDVFHISDKDSKELDQAWELVEEHEEEVEKQKNRQSAKNWKLSALRNNRRERNKLKERLQNLARKLKHTEDSARDFSSAKPGIELGENNRGEKPIENKQKPNELPLRTSPTAELSVGAGDRDLFQEEPETISDEFQITEENPEPNVNVTATASDLDEELDHIDKSLTIEWIVVMSLFEEVLNEELHDTRVINAILSKLVKRFREVMH